MADFTYSPYYPNNINMRVATELKLTIKQMFYHLKLLYKSHLALRSFLAFQNIFYDDQSQFDECKSLCDKGLICFNINDLSHNLLINNYSQLLL